MLYLFEFQCFIFFVSEYEDVIIQNYGFLTRKRAKIRKKFLEYDYLCDSVRPYSLMDRISDSGSEGCGSIPHEGTNRKASAASLRQYSSCTGQ